MHIQKFSRLNLVTRKTEEHTCIVIINWYFLPTEKVCCACFAFSLFFVLKAVVLAWNRLSYHRYPTPHLRSRSQHHFHVIALSVELSWVGWQGCWALPCQLNVQAFLETREQYDLKDSNKQQYWLLIFTIKDLSHTIDLRRRGRIFCNRFQCSTMWYILPLFPLLLDR